MVERYYQAHALNLFYNGYAPIPIKPKTKIPFMRKGESWQVDINKEQIEKWVSNGKGAGGIALTGLCGIDCDVKKNEISNKLVIYIRENIDEDSLIRIGLAPKFLIPASPLSAINKKYKNTWYEKNGEKHEIEFLAPGDQYFCAFGIHPDTMEPFQWVQERSPLNIKKEDLKTWDALDIAGFEDYFDKLALASGWKRDGNHKKRKGEKACRDNSGFENMKTSGEMADPAGLSELKTWLSMLPTAWVDDRDNWIIIGAAIHHETGGSDDGWLIFNQWSQKSSKYKGKKDTIARWESFDKEKGIKNGKDCSTRGTIIHVLQEAGVWKKAKKKGIVARDKINITEENESFIKDSNNIIKNMNKKHAIIRIGSKIRVMNESIDIDGGLDLGFLSVPDFNTLYSNKLAVDPKNPKKQKPLSKIWITNPKRREYQGIVFEPTGSIKHGHEIDGYYNIWRGLSIKPIKGKWDLFKDHIYNVIANGNEIIGDWVVAWIARTVKEPGGKRPGTSIVLKGGQGTGKGVFVNIIGEFFGSHFLPVSHASQIAGRFNSHLVNKILVFIDEGFWAGDKKGEGVLKSIITEPYLAIEQKGIDIIRVRNNINLIIASNNEWVIPANIQERRFFVLDVSDKKQCDKEYFKNIIRQMYKEGGLQGMLYDLLKMDISKIDLGTFQQTKSLYEQKIYSMTTEMQYWHERLQDGSLLSEEYVNKDTGYNEFSSLEDNNWGEVLKNDQYENYLIFSEKMKERFPLSPTQFGIFINKICPGVKNYQKRVNSKRPWHRQFPALKKCREEFDRQLKYKIDWGYDEKENNDDNNVF